MWRHWTSKWYVSRHFRTNFFSQFFVFPRSCLACLQSTFLAPALISRPLMFFANMTTYTPIQKVIIACTMLRNSAWRSYRALELIASMIKPAQDAKTPTNSGALMFAANGSPTQPLAQIAFERIMKMSVLSVRSPSPRSRLNPNLNSSRP